MPESTAIFKPIDWKSVRSSDDEKVAACYVSTVRHLAHGRRDSYRINQYGDHYWSSSMEELTSLAERQRTQGRYFSIVEVPAIALMGTTKSLVVVDTEAVRGGVGAPFSRTKIETCLGQTLYSLGNSIVSQNAYTFKAWVASVSKPAELPFREYWSSPRGANIPLAWETCKFKTNLAPLMQLVSELCIKLHNEG